MDLRRALTRMGVSRQITLGLSLLSLLFLSRLLPPAAFGIFALGIALQVIAALVIDFGVRAELVRRPALRDRSLGEAAGFLTFTTAVVVGGGLCLTWLFGRGAQGSGDLGAVISVLLIGLLPLPVVIPLESQLQRAGRFDGLSIINIVITATDKTVAVILAFAGLGAFSLAIGVVAGRVVQLLLLLKMVRGTRRFHRPRRTGWARYWRSGPALSGGEVIGPTSDLAVASIIAGGLGAFVLGVYNRANALFSLVDSALLQGVRPVILPAFTRALASGVRGADIFATKFSYLSALCWPAFAVMALLADPIIHVLLGDQWEASVRPVQILCLVGVAYPVTQLANVLFISVGAEKAYARVQITQHTVRIIGVAIGAAVSLEFVCLALAVAAWTNAGLMLRKLSQLMPMPMAQLGQLARDGILMTFAALMGPAILVGFVDGSNAPSFFVASGGILLSLMGWIGCLFWLDHPLSQHVRQLLVRMIDGRT